MGHGWPQSFAVSVLRQVRSELEVQHARVLKIDPTVLFDQEAIRRNARAGGMAFDSSDPVALIVVSKRGPSTREPGDLVACAVRSGQDGAMKFIAEQRGAAWTMFELTGVAHNLAGGLTKTAARRRGRG